MFVVEKTAPHQVTLSLSGRLDRESIAAGMDTLLLQSADLEQGQLLYVISDFHWPSVACAIPQLKRLPALLAMRKHIDRVAIVADSAWLRQLGQWKGALVPGVIVRSFHDRHEAERWLNSVRP